MVCHFPEIVVGCFTSCFRTSNLHFSPIQESLGNSDNIAVDADGTNVASLTEPQTTVLEEPEEDARKRNAEERRARREAAKKRVAKSDFWNPQIGSVPKTVFTLLPTTNRPITVHKQLSYNGSDAIPDELSDQSCARMGMEEFLHNLNGILGTAYTLDTPSLRDILQTCIDKGHDFGNAYGYLRPRWLLNFTLFTQYMETYETDDKSTREKALQDDQIVNPNLPPRHIWDLFSNRVLPYWVASSWVVERQLWAVSHSWAAPERRQYVWTEINGRQWSVPIPDDVDLSQLRIELLNLGAEYVWMDVVCLRQNGRDDAENKLLEDEWKLDVPTIGRVYHQGANQPVVCYYSGLGRPFTVEDGALASERHWMNRAWTLQENTEQSIVAGITDTSPPFPPDDDVGNTEVGRFAQQLASLPYEHPTNVFLALIAMQKRSSVNPVDKIAGLAYILQCNPLPVYKLNESAEDAWARLVLNLPDRYKGDLFFLYPSPGDGGLNWAPSWKQILERELPKGGGVYVAQDVAFRGSRYRHRGYVIRDCLLKGFEDVPGDGVRRVGQMVIDPTKPDLEPRNFDMVALHGVSIPDGRYTMISGRGMGYNEHWVVAKEKEMLSEEDSELLVEKVSVLIVSFPRIEKAIREANLGQNMLVALY